MDADYAWMITIDHLEGDSTDVGMHGPHNAPDDLIARLTTGEGHRFELYDDDGELYYSGLIITTGDMAEQAHCFAPLDDFGTGWAGATEVRYPDRPAFAPKGWL
jgi:hypothetical protein